MAALDGQHKHERVVRALRKLRLPGAVGGGLLDWYCAALGRWAPEQDGVTYFGATLRCDSADTIQRMILLFKVWEPGVSKVIEENLEPGQVFVDVGANVGYDSLLAADRVGEHGTVIALEASPRTYGVLQRNLRRNPVLSKSIRTANVAVSDRSGTLDLYEFGRSNIGATTTLATRQGTHCATVTAARLGDVLSADEMSRVRLIKMDVEGAEPEILSDILDHLDDYPDDMDVIIEANPEDDPVRFRTVFERLQNAGFTAWAVDNRYSNGWYLRWRQSCPTRLDKPPQKRRDLLLTRRAGMTSMSA
ncbi:FkbM family methyltransferase [Mycolicibacterium frederiksbergense]|uniref:FkbM family methyltransferase n=1 Tax=Mycolicibacterium frederiksbergense TaxID=117567 RepID=A0A6H0SBJ7_9MYCO|nr:FkbM family methyltransferase [Mycolicibacterium frederiksbergense]QIV84694.1 FkbM family methyltransferase [Mycolicibacterium frederiksbergense]